MILFDASMLLNEAFAINSRFIHYDSQDKESYKAANAFPGAKAAEISNRFEFYQGHRVISQISMPEGDFKEMSQTGEILDVSMPDLYLPPTTLIDYRRAKVVTKTQSASMGTFKEIYAFGDWELNIYGVAIDYKGLTAGEIITALLARERLVCSIPVVGAIFSLMGVNRILIEHFEAKQVAGAPGRIPFAMSCVSDSTIETLGYGVGADL